MENTPHPFSAHAQVSAILNPLRSVGNAMKSVPDTLADGFTRILSGGSLVESPNQGTRINSETVPKRSSSFDSTRGDTGSLEQGKVGDNLDPVSSTPFLSQV